MNCIAKIESRVAPVFGRKQKTGVKFALDKAAAGLGQRVRSDNREVCG